MGYNFVPRMSDVGIRGNRYWYSGLNTFYPGAPLPNCTCYAYGRWLEIAGGDTSKLRGLFTNPVGTRNGGAWYTISPTLQAGTSSPQLGDIACWLCEPKKGKWWGHVAVVEEVHTDYIITSNSYYTARKLFGLETLPKSTGYRSQWMINGKYVLKGFLRFPGAPVPPSTPSYNMPTEWVHYPSYTSMTEDDRQNNAVMAAVQLYSYGWTLEAIAGAIGNFVRESNLDPQATGTGGGGLVGWTPLANLTRWTSYYGYTWYDGETQIQFIDMGVYCSGYDAETGVPILQAQWLPGRVDGITYSQYKAMTQSPETMAELFMRGYEAPGIPALNERKANARKYYDFLQGINLPYYNYPDPIGQGLSVWQMAGNAKPKLIY